MKKIYLKVLGTLAIGCLSFHILSAKNDRSVLDPPQIIKDPESNENYLSEHRTASGIPSLAVSRGGRIWTVWYTGITPETTVERCLNNYIVVSTSGDQGKTWKEVLVIDPDGPGPVQARDPEVWIGPDDQLWIFWAQQIHPFSSTNNGVWAITTSDPEADEPEWSSPRRLVDGVMMCKPVVLSTGEWVLPASFPHVWEESAKMIVSEDHGRRWHERGAVNVPKEIRNHDEHMIVERKDGSLWMLVRTQYGIGESISYDKGFTWTPLIPSRIQHATARFFIRRLNSGNLLLVKHGPIDMQIGRSHLMAFISKDDGYSWSNGLLLAQGPGVTYPDGQQASDGTIYITHDKGRSTDQKIMMTNFSEADIILGTDKQLYEVFRRRRIISQGGVK